MIHMKTKGPTRIGRCTSKGPFVIAPVVFAFTVVRVLTAN